MLKLKIVGALIIALIVGIPLHYQYLSAETITVSVKDINKGDYVSLCIENENARRECNEYENIDDVLWFKWNSGTIRSELAAAMTDKELIKVRVHGYRIEYLDMRKKIVSVVD